MSGIARLTPEIALVKLLSVSLHVFDGLGIKDIGLLLNQNKGTIHRTLRHSKDYKPRKRGGISLPRCYGMKICFRRAKVLIFNEYCRELKALSKYDEQNHWNKHPSKHNYYTLVKYYANHAESLAKVKKYNDARTPAQIIRQRLAARIRKAMMKYGLQTKKTMKTPEYIGCSIPELRQHIEKQFTGGMSWGNYGHNGWHIDHKRPCSSFDLSDPVQQKECFHFSNLQPLWEADNIRKSNKIAKHYGNVSLIAAECPINHSDLKSRNVSNQTERLAISQARLAI